MQGDTPVKISSQGATFRQTVVGTAGTISETFSAMGLPRVFVYANQTSGGVAGTFTIEIAYRMNASNTPDWLLYSNTALVPGGANPLLINIVAGAVYYRFTTVQAGTETTEIAASAFV